MADGSGDYRDGDSESDEDAVEYSGMVQPPLIKQLKTILAEYPDDGQILKEIIQNAEDAEASELKILYDGRHVNNEDINNKKRRYRKYFKGPALVMYNNAEFTEADWEGIRMLYSSIKELDRTKVGRFGLGFKSVFHITDYPMIISGDKLLILDPHQRDPGKVCQTIFLKKLHRCRGMDVSDCMKSLSGIFGFSQATLDSGRYRGTLFRFPLRDVESDLSDNIYEESKVTDLIKSFETEAPVSLLFLKSLDKIELFIKNSTQLSMPPDEEPKFIVKLAGQNSNEVRDKRKNFLEQMKALGDRIADDTIAVSYEITIVTTHYEGGSFHIQEKLWLVYNLFKGGNMSEQLKVLSTDESLGYSPYVGIAFPLCEDPSFTGHVFCFLPLPLETKSLTGLPVHVNGFFALSQNRRHIKWATADQVSNLSHRDKSIQWNECLISEVVSEVYHSVINYLIGKSKQACNQENLVAMVTKCIPDMSEVDDKWKMLIKPVYEKILKQSFLYTTNSGGQWISCSEAVFSKLKKSSPEQSTMSLNADVEETVLMLVKQCNQNLVEVPPHLWNMIQTYGPSSVQCITPSYIRNMLRSSQIYRNFTAEEKIHILQFVLEDGNYGDLHGLELVPLQSGSFTCFENRRSTTSRLFYCCEDDLLMFPGLQDRFVMVALPQCLQHHMTILLTKGLYQLYPFNSSEFLTLLHSSIELQFGGRSCPVEIQEGENEAWLTRVWHYMKLNFPDSLSQFNNTPILPVRTYQRRRVQLYGISSLFILRSFSGMSDLPSDVCACLGHFSIIVIQSLPQYVLDHPMILKKVVRYPNTEGVLSLLNEISNSHNLDHLISEFNQMCTESQKNSFLTFLEEQLVRFSPLNPKLQSLLRKLELFQSSCRKGLVSVDQVQLIEPVLEKRIPVPYPREILVCDEKQRQIAKYLGAKDLSILNLVREILQHMEKQTVYSKSDIQKFMMYMMENMHLFHYDSNVMQRASAVTFVPVSSGEERRPNEVFDCRDPLLEKLFTFENKFPCGVYRSDKGMSFLEKLGLKSSKHLTSKDILDCAKDLHERHVDNVTDKANEKQADAIMAILVRSPQLLNQYIDSYRTLSCQLVHLKFIHAQPMPSNYPGLMNWFGSPSSLYKPSEMFEGTCCKLIGSVAPLLPDSWSHQVVQSLIANRKPNADLVTQQLRLIIEKYEDQYKPELLPLIKDIYTYLASSQDGSYEELKDLACAWTGNGFCKPHMMYVTTTASDISLEPYLYHFPSEFQTIQNIKPFFKHLGSKERQDSSTLITVEESIRLKHSNKMSVSSLDVREDRQLVIKILNQLKQIPNILDFMKQCDQTILFPIHTGNDDCELILKPAKECRYSNADWLKDLSLEEGEEIFFVHPDVPHETAVLLGVPSLTEDLLSDAEGFEAWGQTEPLTRRLKNILKDYTDGFAVPKEIVQNADDAGATKVCFMYDERQNLDARTRLLDENMSTCQGPALWAYNNALFSKKDLENITKLSGATKEEDLQKIGKFGLGFCCVYNLTDVPMFISGDHIVIFDPHAKYLGKAVTRSNPGIKINLKSIRNQVMVKRLKNQFAPFNGVFGCDLTMSEGNSYYDGTLFRLPLRTPSQAADNNEISSQPYTRNEMQVLLDMFMSAAGNLLLFTQNVTEIELHHIPENCQSSRDAQLIYSVTRNIDRTPCSPALSDMLYSRESSACNVVKMCSTAVEQFRNGNKKMVDKTNASVQINIQVEIKANGQLVRQSPNVFNTKWLVSWASGTGKCLELIHRKELKKALPLASVAIMIASDQGITKVLPFRDVPYGFYNKSHFFCYLPLPVETPLPIHINGSFAVTANRRQLCCKTIDDKESLDNRWNEALMNDAVCNAYIQLLESLRGLNMDSQVSYSEIWPIPRDRHFMGNILALQRSFYKTIVQDNPVIFRRDRIWKPFKNCRFLESSLMSSAVGKLIFATVIHFTESSDFTVMELPSHLIQCFEIAGYSSNLKEKIMTSESFYADLFFPNINSDYWKDKENTRDQIVHHALHHGTPAIKQILRGTPCIPSEPKGSLKKPGELVHPKSSVNILFSTEEERFIRDEGKGIFTDETSLKELTTLGLITDILPIDILIDRVNSVKTLVGVCSKCGLERCGNILVYLGNNLETLTSDILSILSDTEFLPIERKPKDWKFPWSGDVNKMEGTEVFQECPLGKLDHTNNIIPVVLGKPCQMYSRSTRSLVACQQLIFDETVLKDRTSYKTSIVLQKLTIRGQNDITAQTVVENLICICRIELSDFDKPSQKLLAEVCADMYKYFDSKLEKVQMNKKEELVACLRQLKDYPVIFLHDKFVKPEKIAMRLTVDCSPCLFGINDNVLHLRKTFLLALDVKDRFSVEEILDVIVSMQEKCINLELSEVALDLFCRLLGLLSDTMKIESMHAADLKKLCCNRLLIPDETSYLKAADDLCMDDSKTIKKSGSMTFVHPKISLDIAQKLGVKTKQRGKLKDHTRKLPFGQKEELTVRLKRILEGYPCDEGIFKELLQNADDADASEIHFVKDFKQHPVEKIFDEQWKPLQGPALLVSNDSSFTTADIEGIQKLGTGSKGDDPTKTGQYGVGFNAVYHLTDAPSFITKGEQIESGETLCVLDPHFRYIADPDEDSPGAQYLELDELRDTYSDVFQCYHEQKLLRDNGTVFRFPLRKYSMSKLSEISDKTISPEEVARLLDKLKDEMFQMLIFVRNVRKITISNITNGNLEEEYSVEVDMSDEDKIKRQKFMEYVKTVNKEISQTHNLLGFEEREVEYVVKIKDSNQFAQSWLVVQRIGVKRTSKGVPEVLLQQYKDGLIGLLPIGGVAVPLLSTSENRKPRQFTAFCFLPLPVTTGLPLLINGYFDLDHETRRSLWHNPNGDNRVLWNNMLLENVITPAYIRAVHGYKKSLKLDDVKFVETSVFKEKLRLFHLIFPDFSKASEVYWKLLVCSFYRQIVENEDAFFVSYQTNTEKQKESIVTFYPLLHTGHKFPSVFDNLIEQMLSKQQTTHSNDTELQKSGILMETCKYLVGQLSSKERNIQPTEKALQKANVMKETCKHLGMKLLDSPRNLLENLKQAGVESASFITPEFVLEFMKTFESYEIPDRCQLQGLDNTVGETTLLNKTRVVEVLRYCKKAKAFYEQVDGLPLCLTNDEVLHVFSSSNPVFCTEYCRLLPSSSDMFLHAVLVGYFSKKDLKQMQVFKAFDTHAFAECLPATLPPEEFKTSTAVTWNSAKEPNQQWIKDLWQFLFTEISILLDGIEEKKERVWLLVELLSVLSEWSLVPCVKIESRNFLWTTYASSRQLLPVNWFDRIIRQQTFSGNMRTALQKMNFPDLDEESLESKVYDMLTILIPDQSKPTDVLKCLYLHQQELFNMNTLTESDCYAVLEYLAENFEAIRRDVTETEIKQQISSLPLHVTIQGCARTLMNQTKVLLLPPGMPSAGIESWGEQTNTVLLKKNQKLKLLYDYFGFTVSSLCDVYAKHIFATFRYLSSSDQMIHLKFVRDELLKYSVIYSPEQLQLIKELSHLPFVANANGLVLTASGFFSPFNSIFQAMKAYLKFPPKPFCDTDWREFMELAGMKKDVTFDMIIEFARYIEREGIRGDTKSRSKTLVCHLLHREDLSQLNLSSIANIKFIVPFEVPGFLESVHHQFNTGNLISFSDSVVSDFHRLVWTNCELLPEWADPFRVYKLKKTVVKQLNVCQSPDFEKILNHMQNVCDSLKESLDKDSYRFNREMIQKLMGEFYEYLQNHVLSDERKKALFKNRLELKPFIYLPFHKKLVRCNQAVKELDEVDVIKPYLYQLPDEFVPYYRLFEILGTNKKATCSNYARVLEDLHNKIGAKEMEPNELQIVRKAVFNFFLLLTKEEVLTVQTLFLPSRQRSLVNSTILIYSDLPTFERVLQNEPNIEYFIGFEPLHISFPRGDLYIKSLPEKYRMKLLSHILKSSVDTSSLIIMNSQRERELQAFIQSPEFIEGILRLIAHGNHRTEHTSNTVLYDRKEWDEKEILKTLQSVRVFQVETLKKTRTFRGEKVHSESIACYFEKVASSKSEDWFFYFSVNSDDWIQRIDKHFADMLDKCVGYRLTTSKSYIFKFLSNMRHPERIKELLDEDLVAEYTMARTSVESVFPPPGTIVDPKWHFMLDNTFTEFDVQEYVALQLLDDDGEKDDEIGQIFMYAIIKEKIPLEEDCPVAIANLLQQYKVDVGGVQTKEIPAYKIYKFNRISVSESKEITPAEHIERNRPTDAEASRPLPDVYREIRHILKSIWERPETERKLIIKRLLRKWHPDKNYGNEDYAKKVFQYIKQCIDALDRGEDIEDVENKSTSSQRSGATYEAWYADVDRSCRRDRDYQEQNARQQASRGSSYSHFSRSFGFSARTEETPLPSEAKRWYKQSCNDLAAAEKFIHSAGDVQGFNWICYLCHQAAEKAMKAAWYNINANNVSRSHDLGSIAVGLGSEIQEIARSLESLLGNHANMRYPDLHQMPNIPSDMYDVRMSEIAIQLTRSLCDAVSGTLFS